MNKGSWGEAMNEKKKRLIEAGMKLIVKKGFHATSIQEIADQAGVSKGAFYLHFESKEAILLAIYHYYDQALREKVAKVKQQDLEPRESLIRQIEVFLESLNENKDFILILIRENVSLSDDVKEFVQRMKQQFFTWSSTNLRNIYGPNIEKYVYDGSILLEGIMHGYFKWLVLDNILVDYKRLATFIVKRLDDAIQGMLKDGEDPIVFDYGVEDERVQVEEVLVTMKNGIDKVDLPDHQKKDLHIAVDLMLQEIKKSNPQQVLFQGMLTHFKLIPQFQQQCQAIANHFGMQLFE